MSKAPAFQFYYDRFNSSTSLWDDAQVGKYVRLLICQANKRYVSEKELRKLVPDNDPDILEKFIEVEPGKFVNKVMEDVLIDRDNYLNKQSENGRKGGRPPKEAEEKPKQNPNETQIEANQKPNHNPNESSTPTPITTPTTISLITPTPKKNIAAEADVYFLDRVTVIQELNGLTGRDFDPHASYVKKHLNPRIKEYGVEDLLDVIRFIVFKRKGSDLEQYLKPDTIFRAEKCASYMADMKHHRDNGLMPKRDVATGKGGKRIYTQEEVLAHLSSKAV